MHGEAVNCCYHLFSSDLHDSRVCLATSSLCTILLHLYRCLGKTFRVQCWRALEQSLSAKIRLTHKWIRSLWSHGCNTHAHAIYRALAQREIVDCALAYLPVCLLIPRATFPETIGHGTTVHTTSFFHSKMQ